MSPRRARVSRIKMASEQMNEVYEMYLRYVEWRFQREVGSPTPKMMELAEKEFVRSYVSLGRLFPGKGTKRGMAAAKPGAKRLKKLLDDEAKDGKEEEEDDGLGDFVVSD